MAGEHDDGGGLYLEPALYDVANAPGTAAEVRALERVVARHAPRLSADRPLRWLEPACGTGRYLRSLRRRGHHVAGYDPAAGMLGYAERRMARWPGGWVLRQASFTTPAREVAMPASFDVAFCPVNSLRHLPDDRALSAHLDQIRAVLRPGGVYVAGVDLHRPDAMIDEDVLESARGGLRVQQVIQYIPPDPGGRREQVIVQMMTTRGERVDHHSWAYGLRTYTAEQWAAAVRRAGWARVATCDASGRAVPADAVLSYQLEVLAPDDAGRARRGRRR